MREAAAAYQGQWRDVVLFVCAVLFTVIWWNINHNRTNWAADVNRAHHRVNPHRRHALRGVLRAAATLIRRQRRDQIEHELESAEPLSGNRMSDLATLRLIAQLVTGLQRHQPRWVSTGMDGRPIRASKYAGNGAKNAASTRPNSPGSTDSSHGRIASHNVGWSFTVLSTTASIPSSPRVRGQPLVQTPRDQGPPRPDFSGRSGYAWRATRRRGRRCLAVIAAPEPRSSMRALA